VNWDDLKLFLLAAESASLTATATAAGMSVATVGRRLAALESSIGLRLVERTPRGLRVTATGRELQALANEGADQFHALERKFGALRAKARAEPVTVSATEPIISEILAPALGQLWKRSGAITVDLRASTDVASLALREADIAIRLFQPSGDSLYVRRVADVSFGLFASAGYLAGRKPEALDLARERILGYDAAYGEIPERAWTRQAGLAFAAMTSSTRALLNAVRNGVGVALLPRYLASDLIEVPGPEVSNRPVFIAIHSDLRNVPRIRAVSTWARDVIAATLARKASRRLS